MDDYTNEIVASGLTLVTTQILGPTAKEIGNDILKLYQKGRENIFDKAGNKIPNIKDGKKANLRVARDVFSMAHILTRIYPQSILVEY
ncbi:MAG: hypothetical protein HC932_00110 [Thermales bacterium]|nr:hypothetical protein [Thermales bacterium]